MAAGKRSATILGIVFCLTLGSGGPDDFVEVEGRYVIGWSCRAHSCFERA